jgi:transposase InsO family protein
MDAHESLLGRYVPLQQGRPVKTICSCIHVILAIDTGSQFTSSRFMGTLAHLCIAHRKTAYHRPEGNSYIQRFHRSLKEEELLTSEYRRLAEA